MFITIKGKKYEFGDLRYNDTNLDLMEALHSLGNSLNADKTEGTDASGMPMVTLLRRLRGAIEECLIDGCGPELAAEAMANLRFSQEPDSDLMRAVQAVGMRMSGGVV